jgi:tetratricopeptide (TPR) repeat protein
MNRVTSTALPLLAALTLPSAALLSGCGGKASKSSATPAEPEIAFTLPEELAAYWVHLSGAVTGGPGEMELFKDGNGVSEDYNITWKVVDGTRFVLLPEDEEELSYSYAVSGVQLTLVDEDGDSEIYIKKEYYDAIRKGDAYLDDGDYDKAIAEITKVLQSDPNFSKGYYLRGMAYFEKKDFAAATADFAEAIRLNPDSLNGYYLRGAAYTESKDFDRAIEDFNKAIQLDPTSEIGYAGRSHVYYEKKDYDSAIADYSKVIELNSEDAVAYNNRGWAYCLKGEYDKGLEDINIALDLDDDQHYIYHSRGYAYSGKKEYDKAIADFTESIRLKPPDEAYTDRGKAHIEKGDYAASVEDFNRAIELNPEYPGAAEGLEKAKGLLAEKEKKGQKKPNNKK